MLMYVIIMFTWIAVWRVQDLIPGVSKLPMGIVAEVLTLGLFFADSSKERQLKWIKSPVLWMVAAIVAFMFFGLPTSLYPGKGLRFMIQDFAPTVILMLVLATSARDRDDLDWLAFAHLIGGVIFAMYVYKFCPLGSDGKLMNLPYYDANDFALLINCSLPFAVYFLRPGVPAKRRLFAAFALGLFVMMIIRSGSRGGFIGLMAVTAYTLVRYTAIPARHRLGAIAAGIAIFAIFGSEQYWTSMKSIMNPEKDYNMTEDTGRKAVWTRGLHYMEMRPFFGVGIRAFPEAEGNVDMSPTAKLYQEIGKGIKWSVAHNSFVEIGAECGPTALVLFLSMIGITLYGLERVRAGPKGKPWMTPDDQAYAQMLFASLLGFCVCGFFVSAEYFAYLYVILGLSLAFQGVLRRKALRPPGQTSIMSSAGNRPPLRRRQVSWVPAAE